MRVRKDRWTDGLTDRLALALALPYEPQRLVEMPRLMCVCAPACGRATQRIMQCKATTRRSARGALQRMHAP